MAGIGITQLTEIYANQNEFRLGQIVGPPEGLQGTFKFIQYIDGVNNIRGIQGLPTYKVFNTTAASDASRHQVTGDVNNSGTASPVNSPVPGGVLVGNSPLGFTGGGVYQDEQFGFVQLTGIPIANSSPYSVHN